MSFFKSILRRVKRTAKAQVGGAISSFVGRSVASATQGITRNLQTKVDGSINSLKEKATAAGVASRRSGFLSNLPSRTAKGAIARAKGEKLNISDPFGR